MGIFRTNDPTQFTDVDGIIIDESAPAPSIRGVASNVALLVGQFQRGPTDLIEPGSIGRFHELFGKSSYSGNKQLRNKRFGRLKIIRVVASDAAKAKKTFGGGEGEDKEVFTIQTTADTGGDSDGKAVTFEVIASDGTKTSHYVWWDVDGGGNDPSLEGTGHGVSISTGDDAATKASALQAVLDGISDLSATVSTDTVTATLDVQGDVEDAEADDANDMDTVTVSTQGNAPDVIKFTALYEGDYGNNIEVKIEEGTAEGMKYTFTDNNSDSPLSPEVYDNVKIAEIENSTFAGSNLVEVEVLSTSSEPLAETLDLAGGSDGTVADEDYETAIEKGLPDGSGNIMFLDAYNATRNGYLQQHAADAQNKMVVVCGTESDTVQTAVSDVANYRDSDGRVIYAYPYIQTRIDGALEYTPPASWYASIVSQTGPNIDPAYAANTQFLAGIVALKQPSLSRANYIQLMNAGISAFENDPDIGFKVKSGVVTQIVNSSKITVVRRRMADFLTNSIAKFLKAYQNGVNSAEKRREVKAQIQDFVRRSTSDGLLPTNNEVQDGRASVVDTESLNTDSVIASGQFRILYKQRIFSSMRFIVLQAEIGESVVVTESE